MFRGETPAVFDELGNLDLLTPDMKSEAHGTNSPKA
jgi:hypothetical protein